MRFYYRIYVSLKKLVTKDEEKLDQKLSVLVGIELTSSIVRILQASTSTISVISIQFVG